MIVRAIALRLVIVDHIIIWRIKYRIKYIIYNVEIVHIITKNLAIRLLISIIFISLLSINIVRLQDS